MLRFACASAIALATLSCRGKRDPDCLTARNQARDAAMHGDLDHASELLDEAREQCGSEAAIDIQRIQGVIDSRRRARDQQARIEDAQRSDRERFPVHRLLDWLKKGVVNPDVVGLECPARGSPDFGFCQGQRRGEPKMSVRYWDGQRDAFRYTYVSELPLSCVDAGEHRRVRTWTRQAIRYELCELTQHEVRSLSALVERKPTESTIFVYSQAYLQKDKAFAEIVAGKG